MDLPGIQSWRNTETNQSQSPVSHLAIDIGGSLIKLVYFSSSIESPSPREKKDHAGMNESLGVSSGDRRHPVLEGKLRFAKFETGKINDCIEFISSKALHLGGFPLHKAYSKEKILVKATGGGAYKFSELFNEKLSIVLDKEDEMDCLVAGANFLLKAVHQEAFTYLDGKREFYQIDTNDMYPYLLVNIGSGVSMIKVDGDEKFERVSGTSVGGGTFLGLAKLLTKCNSFDELLELSQQGNNRKIDMLVGDIYGGNDYTKIGLSSTTIASSFGKVIPDTKELEDYNREDIARSLLRMISNNIGQLAYLTALRLGLKRIFFGGFFIRGHAYTMDTISVAVNFWSNGEAKAMFLRHEGFLGALGAFSRYEKHGLDGMIVHHMPLRTPLGMSCAGDTFSYPPSGEVNDSESIECTVYAM